ncbi:hypothetical protein BT63DRAFT_456453 [Microthyrium microscopicum]|uniref:Uncharacterized protein n=1 Tax=Microthyrium microscopicum TaxID=703497 RepID=A0A6A6UA43_9PEZI|nr:hypothetical protein BT63DRAFT_456453 [Microthyrium microscopicum]
MIRGSLGFHVSLSSFLSSASRINRSVWIFSGDNTPHIIYGPLFDRRKHRQTELELIDGSRKTTQGVIKNILWNSGDNGPVKWQKFYVLKHLPFEVVLGNDLLYADAFNRYESMFEGVEANEKYLELGLIRNVGDFSENLRKLYTRFLRNTSDSSGVSEHSMMDSEMSLRQDIRDEIENLYQADRSEAWRLEEVRRAQFLLRRNHIQLANQTAQLQPTPAAGGDGQPSRTRRLWYRIWSFIQ